MADNRLKFALKYHEAGITVIKARYKGKSPPKGGKWKKYKSEPVTKEQLMEWFGPNSSYCNVSAITGASSGGLTVLDFDSVERYKDWKKNHPELAKILPTSKSGRGYHVFFRSELTKDDTSSFDKIDVKASGLVSVPPSKHKNGLYYEWVNPLPAHVKEIPLLTLPQLGLRQSDKTRAKKSTALTQQIQQTQNTEQTEQTNTMEVSDGEVAEIVLSTLPDKCGRRNRQIFYLALKLKSIPGNWDKNPREFLPVVKVWHEEALPNIATKRFVDTWGDFTTAWENVKYDKIDVAEIYELCKEDEAPPQLVEDHPTWLEAHRLCVLCRELQRAHKVFGTVPYLSARTMGDLLGISHETANKYFRILVGERYIRIIKKGYLKEGGGVATEFIYIGEL